jgi:hypothetical protein
MPKRSPWESYHKRQRAINAKVFDLMQSTAHMCLCSHAQGFHWDTDEGKNVGKCADADCPCEAFDEDVLYHARLRAELAAGGTAKRDDAGDDDDALAGAMRAEDQREVTDDEAWDWALHADRPRPTGTPRPSAKQNPAVLDALREIGGHPDDLTG